jgi:hypothetical protein
MGLFAKKEPDAGMGHLLPTEAPRSDAPDGPKIQDRRQYDLVLSYPLPSDEQPASQVTLSRREVIAARARAVGIAVSKETTRDGSTVLLKLAAPDELCETLAEQLTMEKKLKAGGYTDYTRGAKAEFAPASDESFFTSAERVRLLLRALELDLSEGGCAIDIDDEMDAGVLSQVSASLP